MMESDAYLTEIYRAGEVAPPGAYLRIDDGSRRMVVLEERAPLPPGFDGHVALYRRAAPRFAPARAADGAPTADPLPAHARVHH